MPLNSTSWLIVVSFLPSSFANTFPLLSLLFCFVIMAIDLAIFMAIVEAISCPCHHCHFDDVLAITIVVIFSVVLTDCWCLLAIAAMVAIDIAVIAVLVVDGGNVVTVVAWPLFLSLSLLPLSLSLWLSSCYICRGHHPCSLSLFVVLIHHRHHHHPHPCSHCCHPCCGGFVEGFICVSCAILSIGFSMVKNCRWATFIGDQPSKNVDTIPVICTTGSTSRTGQPTNSEMTNVIWIWL